MQRPDRLFDLIQILRDGRLHRAQDIADQMQVSVRTIYRDMDTLIASGVPIMGERGLGYMATAAITLPPLNLSGPELEALRVGLAMVGDVPDAELQAAARSLSAKIDAALPEDRTAPTPKWGLAVYPFRDAAHGFEHMPALRGAVRARQKLQVRYQNLEGGHADWVIRPLQLEFWGRVWTATVWCEDLADFAVLRLDRIEKLTVMPQLFIDETGKSLADFRARRAPSA